MQKTKRKVKLILSLFIALVLLTQNLFVIGAKANVDIQPTILYNNAAIYEGLQLEKDTALTLVYRFNLQSDALQDFSLELPANVTPAEMNGAYAIAAADPGGVECTIGSATVTDRIYVTYSPQDPDESENEAPSILYNIEFSIPVFFSPADGEETATLASNGTGVEILVQDNAAATQNVGFGILSVDSDFDNTTVTLSDVSLKKSGADVSGTEIADTDILALRIDFDVPDFQALSIAPGTDSLTEGDLAGLTKYHVNLPPQLKWAANISIPLIATVADEGSFSDLQFGYLVVNAAANEAYVVFGGPFWGESDDLGSGFITANCQLNPSGLGTDYSQDLLFFGVPAYTIPIFVTSKKPAENAVEKTGTYDPNTGILDWTVVLTPAQAINDEAITLADTFATAQQTFVDGSMKVTIGTATVPVNPDVIAGDPDTTLTLSDHICTVAAGEPITITYQTGLGDNAFLDASGKIPATPTASSIPNAVAITTPDGITTEASTAVAVTAEQKQFMLKDSEVVAGSNNRKVKWTLTVNTSGRNIANLKLHDIIPSLLTLEDNKFVVTYVDGASTTVDRTPSYDSETGEYTIDLPTLGSGEYASAYTITYVTVIPDSYFEGSTAIPQLVNVARLSFDWYRWGTGTTPFDWGGFVGITKSTNINSSIIEKTAVNYNAADHTITWKVVVNPHLVHILGGVITDDLKTQGLAYKNGTFASSDSAIALDTSNTDADTLVVNVAAMNKTTGSYTFDTYVTDPAVYNTNTKKTYHNSATFVGTVNPDIPVTHTASASIDYTSTVLGKTATSYNYETNRMSWTVTVNQNKMPMTNAYLEDILPAGHTLDTASVHIGSSTGTASSSAAADDAMKYTISLGTISGATVAVTFDTILDVDAIAAFKSQNSISIPNTITLYRDEYPAGVSATGSKTITNNVLQKTGADSGGGEFLYTVGINPNGMDLSGLVIKDQLPSALRLDVGSIALYPGVVNATTGIVTKSGMPAIAPLTWSMDSANNSFSVTLPDGNGRYVLEYSCFLTDYTNSGPFHNSISFNDTVTGSAGANASTVSIGASGGGSSTASKKLWFEITNVDEERPGVPIKDATFELYLVTGEDTYVLVDTQTTDGSGKAKFFPLSTGATYVLRQTVYPSGYSNSKVGPETLNEYSLVTVSTDKGKTLTATITSVPNKGNIILFNRNDIGYDMQTGTFSLTEIGGGSATTSFDVHNGRLDLGELPFGVYELTQTATAAFHDLNPTTYTITVDADKSYTIVDKSTTTPLDAETIINTSQKADVVVVRYDRASGAPLSGNLYTVYDQYGKVVATATTDAAGKASFIGVVPMGMDFYMSETFHYLYISTPNKKFQLTDPANPMNIDWPKDRRAVDLGLGVGQQPTLPSPDDPDPEDALPNPDDVDDSDSEPDETLPGIKPDPNDPEDGGATNPGNDNDSDDETDDFRSGVGAPTPEDSEDAGVGNGSNDTNSPRLPQTGFNNSLPLLLALLGILFILAGMRNAKKENV